MKTKLFSIFLICAVFFCTSVQAQVTVYEHTNYGGKSQVFNEGFHKGYFKIGNDVISSVKVAPGYSVTLYEHGVGTGKELTLTSDTPDLVKLNFNDVASNLRVDKVASISSEQAFDGWYRLKTQFRGDNECLEGNQAANEKVAGGMNGGAFMDKCQNVSGQIWKIEPAGNGHYRLKNQFRGDGESLESNNSESKAHGGAAFMDKNQNVSGQLWKIVPAGNGYYRLKSMFRGNGESLEGNQRDSKVHGGAAFMAKDKNVSGQLWKIEKVK